MKRSLITPVSLAEMYVQPGEHSTKFLLDPKRSATVEIESVVVVDSDGRPMRSEFRRWGTKLHVSFVIDDTTPDGVALIDFILGDGSRQRFKAWIIK